MKGLKTYLLAFIVCFSLKPFTVFSQDNPEKGIYQIEKWIKADSITEAQALLETKLTHFRSTKNYDSLISYIEIVGSYALAKGDRQKAYKKAEQFVAELNKSNDPTYISLALQRLGYLHSGTGDPRKTYAIFENAYEFAKQSNNPKKADLANVKYRLGYEAQNFGDFQLAKKHYLDAAKTLDYINSKDVEFYQQIYNAL
ncbi:MAG TPA: hypothetical protein DCS66_19130, partial [Flavobacteriaceae bacterium]|nr:hypothetical protein [Flavobacteriaceae bacterium]